MYIFLGIDEIKQQNSCSTNNFSAYTFRHPPRREQKKNVVAPNLVSLLHEMERTKQTFKQNGQRS